MRLNKRLKLECQVEIYEDFLEDYKEMNMIIFDEMLPKWAKRIKKEWQGIGINDVMIVKGEGVKRDFKGYIDEVKRRIRHKR
jgi:hypothetical protein